MPRAPRKIAHQRHGFSMVESLTAITITTIAGAALLASVHAAVQVGYETRDVLMARGLAEQLMDEIATVRFPRSDDSVSISGTREQFDDLIDFADWSANPPEDRFGRRLGHEGDEQIGGSNSRPVQMRPADHFLDRLTRTVDVEFVEANGTSGWSPVARATNTIRVTVRVSQIDPQRTTRSLAEVSRVFSDVVPDP